jgi:hypothetical protein
MRNIQAIKFGIGRNTLIERKYWNKVKRSLFCNGTSHPRRRIAWPRPVSLIVSGVWGIHGCKCILTHLGYDFYIKSHYIDIVECGLIDWQVYVYPLAA